ncbi:hypothetical protein Ssi02_59260 [Sinosporangium siamense]|uniref:Uncharacterized protein n=2 Tax=Sinosporangium siamense TaxID=1367973 RepID=A0A919RKV5_9ACTN|nr:hypothetical protein Ssi02_59260 [Sinosporangium siamense]
MIVTADGRRWLFGAHARWYLQDPADGRWHLAAPPADARVRASARVLRCTTLLVPQLVPRGPDFTHDRGSTQGFVGPDVPLEVVKGVRKLLKAHGRRSREHFPLTADPFAEQFAKDVPSTVAAVWGTVVWCAYSPAFDGNEMLLSMFGEFLGKPLPGDDWVRWLVPPSLTDLAGLYGERVRAGAEDPALFLLALMADAAEVLADDARFRPKAAALVAMLEPELRSPGLDHRTAEHGDVALREAWLARCPQHLRDAAVGETSPGDRFRHAVYDVVRALDFVAGRGVDPRAAAGALLAADLATAAPQVFDLLAAWLDPELRHIVYAVLNDEGHPLRGYWPRDGELPTTLRPPSRDRAAALLGAGYAMGLAWCALTGVTPPTRGFTGASAVVGCLIHERDDPR